MGKACHSPNANNFVLRSAEHNWTCLVPLRLTSVSDMTLILIEYISSAEI